MARSVSTFVRRWWRRGRWPAVNLLLLGVVAVLGSMGWVRHGSRAHIYDPDSVPAAPVALVLGAQVGADGTPLAFLEARLALAKRLFDTGKVRALLVSGDHARWEYDEPGAMKRWLVERGVPAAKVVVDHAGFDTYDSCVRANRIFGVRAAVVVTQTFHLPRAVTLCREVGIAAVGVGDESVRHHRGFWRRGSVREYGASVKAAADVLSARDPTFLGPYEPAVDQALRR